MTLVVRIRPNNRVKARLCLRGDCMRSARSHFLSVPAGDRCLIRYLPPCAINMNYRALMCDISQTFLQSDVLPESDRYYDFRPPRIQLSPTECSGAIRQPPHRQKDAVLRYLFRCNRPIYGPTDAPIRWYVTLESRPTPFQISQITDLRWFSRRDPHRPIL